MRFSDILVSKNIWLDEVNKKKYSNITTTIRLAYGGNELESDYFLAFLSRIQNVLKIYSLPHCA